MKQYTDLLREIMRRGRVKQNRTGVDTISLIDAPQMVFDMDDGFPLLTERPIFFRGVVGENIWFLKGVCNNEDLLAQNIKIWDKWALKQDTPVRQLRDLGEMVDEYTEIRHRELGVEEMSMEALQKTSEIVQAELKAADDEDEAKGLPVLSKKLDAKSPEDLQGGFRLLREKNVSPYTTLATMPKGYLGPIYGVLWRSWPGLTEHEYFDQIKIMLDKLGSANPKLRYSRANIVTAFHPALLPDETQNAETNILQGRQALAACHTMFQLFAEPLTIDERIALAVKSRLGMSETECKEEEFTEALLDAHDIAKDRLSLKLYQRSADVPVGIPFNIAGYALLLHMFAAQLNMKPGLFIHQIGDAHIYVDQMDGVRELLARVDDEAIEIPALPQLKIKAGVKSIFDYQESDFELVDYVPLKPQIKFPVAE